MTENISPKTYWVVHRRDDPPNEVYESVDEDWVVSIAESESGRPQPYIRTINPKG